MTPLCPRPSHDSPVLGRGQTKFITHFAALDNKRTTNIQELGESTRPRWKLSACYDPCVIDPLIEV